MRSSNRLNTSSYIFQNRTQDYAAFHGHIISSQQLELNICAMQNIAIIGLDQHIASKLEKIRQQAHLVQVFQIQPSFVLPQNEQKFHRNMQHPLLIRNKRQINTRVKSILALRFLDTQIQDTWLKRQLTPNLASDKKQFLKSDDYYYALQQSNCQLITWPIKKITQDSIECVDGSIYRVDLIIRMWTDD
ncbi:flavoprotein [Acinetobacter sp. GXMZU3951]|jgi:hypothetical protein